MKKFQPVLDIFYIILIYAWLCFNIIDFIKENPDIADKTVYTGMIDEFFDYKLGVLEYRRVYFEDERLDTDNYQGNAVVNYTERDVEFTRIIEHKHFEYGNQDFTIISKEYPLL